MDGNKMHDAENNKEFGTFGSNQSGMRDSNERLVMTILRRAGALPKAEIARRTGLSAQTVSVIMRALESDGLLEKGEKVRGKVGQPSVPMRLAPNGAYFFGLKVGRRSAELILVDFAGTEIAHVTRRYAYPTPTATLEFVKSSVAQICETLRSDQTTRIAGLGIAVPFFLWDWASIIGVDAIEMAAWRGFDLKSEIGQLFEFPIYLGNDASCACGAELVFGTAETPSNYLYIYIGHFIGGGVVLNGTLFTGNSGNAGAIGPFPVRHAAGDSAQLVDVASLIGLERRLIDTQGNADAMIDQQDHWDIGPSLIHDWIDEAAPSIARTILGAISIIDFQLVLIDGNMPAPLRSMVVARISKELSLMNLSGLIAPQISTGSLGPRARPLGAASLPLSKRFMLEA